MACPHCGGKIPDYSIYCTLCGRAIWEEFSSPTSDTRRKWLASALTRIRGLKHNLELQGFIRDLESRIWDMEGHSAYESLSLILVFHNGLIMWGGEANASFHILFGPALVPLRLPALEAIKWLTILRFKKVQGVRFVKGDQFQTRLRSIGSGLGVAAWPWPKMVISRRRYRSRPLGEGPEWRASAVFNAYGWIFQGGKSIGKELDELTALLQDLAKKYAHEQ